MLQVPCTANKEIVNKLQQLAKEMESKLDNWKGCIALARKEYYELNYYTTIQLLTLRQTLGVFKEGGKDVVVPAEVLALLQSIHPKVDKSIVIKAVHMTISNSRVSVAQNSSMASELNEDFDTSGISESSMLSNKHTSEHSSRVETRSIAMLELLHEDLTEQQRVTIAYVTSRIGCSENLVLKALKTLPIDESDDHDYANWCAKNANLDSFSDDNSETDSEANSESMEMNLEEDEFTSLSGNELYLV